MKIMKYLLSTLVVLMCITVAAQMPRPMENHTTPNVSTLGTFGEYYPDLFTGQPSISIPIYEVAEGKIKIPIYLSYSLSSVKPNTHSSWVGLGWQLNSGGYISRNVRGFMDEKKYALDSRYNGHMPGYYSNYSKVRSVSDVESLKIHGEHINSNSGQEYELMADEFSFNFCGYSGTFYLDENGKWFVISDQKIKVEFSEEDGFISNDELRINTSKWDYELNCDRYFNKFTLITPDGYRYVFGGKDGYGVSNATEYSISYFNRDNSDLIPTTWFLTEVVSPEGSSVKLTYEAGDPICEIKYAPMKTGGVGFKCGTKIPGSITFGRIALTGYLMFPVYLKTIESSLCKIEFTSTVDKYETKPVKNYLGWANNTVYNPEDDPLQALYENPFKAMNDPILSFHKLINIDHTGKESDNQLQEKIYKALSWRQLDKIKIKSKVGEENAKTFHFLFDKFFGSKKLLSSLVEASSDNIEGQPIIEWEPIKNKQYKFDYNLEKRLPAILTGTEDFWGYNNGLKFDFSDNFDIVLQKREVAGPLDIAQAETLKSITFPTGGKTEFEYEKNESSQIVSTDFATLTSKMGVGGGLRIAGIRSYSDDGKLASSKKYYYTKNTYPSTFNSSGILNYDPQAATVINYVLKSGSIINNLIGNNNYDAYLRIQATYGNFISFGTNYHTPTVGYSSVIEESVDDENNSLGYIRYTFSNYDTDIWGETHTDDSFLFSQIKGQMFFNQFSSKSQERGKKMSEEYYDKSKNLKKVIKYKYKKVGGEDNYMKTIHQERINICPFGAAYANLCSAFKTYGYSYLLEFKEESMYENESIPLQTVRTIYDYNQDKMLKSEIVTNSNGQIFENEYFYTGDHLSRTDTTDENVKNECMANAKAARDICLKECDSPNIEYECGQECYQIYNSTLVGCRNLTKDNFKELLSKRNILSYPMSITNYLKNGNSRSILNSVIYTYKENRYGHIVTDKKLIFESNDKTDDSNGIFYKSNEIDSRFKIKEEYECDINGNILEITEDGMVTVYLWSYSGQYPIAEIKNTTYAEIKRVLNWDDTAINALSNRYPYGSDWSVLNNLRSILPKAFITTYKYNPLLGIIEITDPSNQTTYYDYDSFGRLKEIYFYENEEKRIIQSHDYHYYNQQH